MGRSPSRDDSGLKKGPWTTEEDELLINHIQQHGHISWRALPKLAGLNRCGKSCRLRWTNYLRPDIKRGKFSQDEEQTILHLHSILGNKWSTIATHLPGRTDNEIKNFWNTHLKKKLIQMGFDPMTHRPRTDIFSSLPHLIALANLKDLMEQSSWEEQAIRFQSDAVQMARLQYLQNLIQPQPNTATTTTNSFSSLKSPPMDIDTYNLLSSLSSMNPSQFGTQTPSSSLENINNIQSIHDSIIPFSHMPELYLPSSFETNMNKEMVQTTNSDYSVTNHGENSSASLSPPLVVNPQLNEVSVGNNIGDGGSSSSYEVNPSSFWNEVLLEESLFHGIG